MLSVDDFFDLTDSPHAEFLQQFELLWQAVPELETYILQRLRPGMHGQVSPQATVAADVEIGEGSVVEAGATVLGPTIIGKNCVVRAGAYIRGRCLIGNNVVIGHASELKNVLVMDGSAIAHFNYVGDSILGRQVHMGAGAVVSNLKIPMSEIVVQTVEQNYPTGLLKFGAILGDHVEVGANSVINPGSLIGTDSVLYPLTSWRGVVGPRAIVKNRQTQEIVIKQDRL